MSHSNLLLDPLLLQEDERTRKTGSSSQRASSMMPGIPFIEQKVPFIKKEQEEELVYHPVSTQLGDTPELKYEDGHKFGSCSSLSAEEHDARNNNPDHLSSYKQDRKSTRMPQNLPPAQSGSFKSPEEYDQYVGDLTSLQKYQPGASDHLRPSSPQASIQTGDSESFPPSTGLQPVSSDSNRPSDDIYYDAGGVSQAQPHQYQLTHDQSPGGQTLPIQHSINENVVDNQYYSSQAFDSPPVSQAPEPGLDLDEYPELQPGVITMNLPTPATIQEVEFLQSWIPRNKLDIENFYAARPGLNQPGLENSSKQDQVDTVMRHMLAEHGAIIDERQSIHGRYDQLGAVLIGQFRLQNPEHAFELQRQGDLAFLPSATSQTLSYPSRTPHSGLRHHSNLPRHNNYEEIGGPDVETVKQWGGIRNQINNKGVYHEVLHRRRTTLGAKYHPETKQMMALPYSTGENLTDRDILQLARLSPFQRHLRASKFFNERGEFYTRHKRFTEMSDARLRREGLLRSWIPRKAGDRPHNSVERAARAAQLGLTGDDKLIADAAAERLRRAAAEKKLRESKAA
ncbi:uncharacterized protein EAE98_010791 [Botrytis deweyae]|uniref:Uncharacterized protein n=1 Tax=Botrytis deweyae TaxID=2478750 RepID=A0ABQ7I818_9HELO|nr:uncharacterized protein EAE98_010791 [Botrytis deweyae]KAF7916206.1 hypothetical protein EAE98_010791 [Botrytis deweyae]